MMPTLLLCLLATLGPQLLVDRVFYGRWVVRACVLPSRPRFSIVVSCLAGEHALPVFFCNLSGRAGTWLTQLTLFCCVQLTQLNWAVHYIRPSAAANSRPTCLAGPSFYRRSAGSDFGPLLPLALALPLLARLPGVARSLFGAPANLGLPGQAAKDTANTDDGGGGEGCGPAEGEAGGKQAGVAGRARRDLLVALVPLYGWSLLLSLLPCKRAHFLYPVYPLVRGEG